MTHFTLDGTTAVVTGGSGTLGLAMGRGLARAGARVALLGRRAAVAEAAAASLRDEGLRAMALVADVLDPDALERASEHLAASWGEADVLVTAAGGNLPDAVVAGDRDLFALTPEAFRSVVELNLDGTLNAIRAFAPGMARRGRGAIITVSSMTAQRPLSRVLGYGAAKAGVDNMTRWLASHMAETYGQGVRVNAIAPGFFVGEQNRSLLIGPGGEPTPRGRRILDNTPMARFGDPDDLVGTLIWLASDASRFVTGVVVPVDGGYSAFGGV